MNRIRLAFVSIMMLIALHASAQLTIGTQIRPRAEFRNGFKTLTINDRNPAVFIEQRSRLFANYNTEKFEVKINFQDVRIWGSTNQVYKTETGTLTNIYEAWGRYRFNPNWSFKIGRMDLDYDNARFLGNLDWAAQGRSHDALVFTYQTDSADFRMDIGGAFNQYGTEPAKLAETYYLGVNNYKTMQFIWLHQDLDAASFSALIHNDGRQVAADSSMAYRQTYGLVAKGTLNRIGWNAEAYYQGGENVGGGKLSAFLLSASLTVPTSVTPVTVGFDMLSGTSIGDTKDQSFNPLYGTNHKFYGYMDYFYVGNAHGQTVTSGLVDYYIKSKFKFSDRSSLLGHLHIFKSAADLYDLDDLTTSVSPYLGTELDLVLNYSLDKDVNLNLGYSQMFAGESMELVKSTPGDHNAINNWVWFMINFNPKVLVNK